MDKIQKNYSMDRHDVEIIQRVKEEQGFKTEIKALRHILHEYEELELESVQSERIAQQILKHFETKYDGYWKRLYRSVRETDKSMSIMLYIMNTILLEDNMEKCIPPTLYKSPVIEEAELFLEEDIRKKKQKKDNRKRKNRCQIER